MHFRGPYGNSSTHWPRCRWPCRQIDCNHYDVIKWKHFPRYWPFLQGIHRSPVNFHHKGQWRGALMFSLICAWINHWVKNNEAGDWRRYRAHYDVTVMIIVSFMCFWWQRSTGLDHCFILTCGKPLLKLTLAHFPKIDSPHLARKLWLW